MHPKAQDAKLAKAARLVVEGKVTDLPVRAFMVRGGSGTYVVTIIDAQARFGTGPVPPRASCTCAWGRSGNEGFCSHILAARAIIAADAPPVDPFAVVLRSQEGDNR